MRLRKVLLAQTELSTTASVRKDRPLRLGADLSSGLGLLDVHVEGAVQKADWGTLEVGQIVEARCTGMNKGGLEMEIAHHKGFMPAGQVDVRHVADISVFLGEKFPVQIVELNKDKKGAEERAKAAEALEKQR